MAGLALSATSTSKDGVQLYAWDAPTSTALVRWRDPREVNTGWTPWACLDLVPGAERLAAMNLRPPPGAPSTAGGAPEVFALSGGVLLVRRQGTEVWSPWLPFSLPTQAAVVSDVAAVGGTRPRVYIVDRGRVFVRSKVVSQDPYADYEPWLALPNNGAVLIAAVQTSDSSQLVATIDASGLVETAVQSQPGAAFSDWTPLSQVGGTIVDLDIFSVGGVVVVYALDASGILWRNATGAAGPSWVSLTKADAETKVLSIAVARNGDVYGLDSRGFIYQVNAQQTNWTLVTDSSGG
jgi:hypothetical protein